MLRIFIIFIALLSTISVDAQSEVIGGCAKKSGTESGINATNRLDNGQQFPIAVFISDPSSQPKISDIAKQLLELKE